MGTNTYIQHTPHIYIQNSGKKEKEKERDTDKTFHSSLACAIDCAIDWSHSQFLPLTHSPFPICPFLPPLLVSSSKVGHPHDVSKRIDKHTSGQQWTSRSQHNTTQHNTTIHTLTCQINHPHGKMAWGKAHLNSHLSLGLLLT